MNYPGYPGLAAPGPSSWNWQVAFLPGALRGLFAGVPDPEILSIRGRIVQCECHTVREGAFRS